MHLGRKGKARGRGDIRRDAVWDGGMGLIQGSWRLMLGSAVSERVLGLA